MEMFDRECASSASAKINRVWRANMNGRYLSTRVHIIKRRIFFCGESL